MITVQDILDIPELDLRLLTGASSSGNAVRWVHVAEVPHTARWLRGGEVLLTTGHGFSGSATGRVEQLEELIDRDVAGLGFGTGLAFDSVPGELVALARSREFPLFEVPPQIPFPAIIEAVAAKIVNAQYSLLQRSVAVHEKLMTLVLEEEGLEAILKTLTGLISCAAVLFDFHGVVLCSSASRRELGGEQVAALWSDIADRRADRAAFAPDGFDRVRVYPVVAAHRIGAFLAVVKDTGDIGDGDSAVLRSVVTALALELVKKKAVVETEKRLAGDFLDQLTAGELYEDEIARRLRFFGLDPLAFHLMVLIDPDGAGGSRADGSPVISRGERERLRWAVDEFMAERKQLSISASRDDRILILLQPRDPGEAGLEALAAELLAALATALPEVPCCIGLGRAHRRLIDLSRSYHEASYAVTIRRRSGGTGMVAGFADLGSYGLLLGLQDTPSLEMFCESVLGSLKAHDARGSSDLLKSLSAFLAANGRWGDAADELYVHRHTLRYRMRRVQEVTGRDLDDPQDRMEFWLALKAQGLLDALRASQRQ
jgi:purine catabolism regulator